MTHTATGTDDGLDRHTRHAPTGVYVGRHRNPHHRPRPLPLQQLDGIRDASVTVHLGISDPYVMLTSDVDQVIVALSASQVERILTSAAKTYEKPVECSCFDRAGRGADSDCPVHWEDFDGAPVHQHLVTTPAAVFARDDEAEVA